MAKSKSQRMRGKRERAGLLSPAIDRGAWQRKPMTQVQPNKKAEQRRTLCRNTGHDDGAFPCAHRKSG